MTKTLTKPTEAQIQSGMMALLRCSASDLESYSPKMFSMYEEEVVRIFMMMKSEQSIRVYKAMTPD